MSTANEPPKLSDSLPVGAGMTLRKAIVSIGRVLTVIAVVLVAYALQPFTIDTRLGSVALLVISLALFGAVLYWQLTATLRSTRPVQRGLEALGITATLFLCLFALQYLAQEQLSPGSFTQPIDKFDALYYTVVTFATVGFGDIAPVTRSARAITMVQIVGDLIFIGAGVKVLTMAAKKGLSRMGS